MKGRDCYVSTSDVDDSNCIVGCTGLYADVDFVNSSISKLSKDGDLLTSLINDYEKYKRSKIGNFEVVYDGSANWREQFKTVPKSYQPLRVVQIYFNTATYDENVKDVSVTLADQLGAIGGTMGLLTGFSIISGVEIFYFGINIILQILKKVNKNCSE